MVRQTSDRRNFTRISFNTEVEIRTDNGVIRSKEGVNVCLNGLHLSTDEILSPGTACRVSITLLASEDRLSIEAAGTVVRSVPGNLAVTFTEIDLDSYQHLRLLILNNAEQAEKAEEEFRSYLKNRVSSSPD